MAEHVWTPDPVTRAAGESARVRYEAAQHTDAGVQLPPSPALVAMKEEIVRAWPGVYSGGMVRDAARQGTVGSDPHRAGIAVDFMLRDDGQRVANGDALARFLVRNAEALGIQYVLWSRYEWSASHVGPKWEAYTGTDPHVDHVHAELGPDARQWPADVMRARVRTMLTGDQPSNTGRNVVVGVVAAGVTYGVVRWLWR